jgi:hypothetical protein
MKEWKIITIIAASTACFILLLFSITGAITNNPVLLGYASDGLCAIFGFFVGFGTANI